MLSLQHSQPSAWRIWFISVSFVLFQFFLQLSSGVVLDELMLEFQFSALRIGLLSSAFYYVYTTMQIPVGILFDRLNARLLLAVNALICAIGCFLFAKATSFFGLFAGRLLIGAGSAFAFVGTSHLIRNYFPVKQFAFMIGISETLGFIVTVLGMVLLSALIMNSNWQSFMTASALFGLFISYLCFTFIPDTKNQGSTKTATIPVLRQLLTNPYAWINGLFCGLGFSIIIVFAAMWAVPFIKLKLHVSLFLASSIDAMIYLGAAIGLPLFGKLYVWLPKRKSLIQNASFITTFLVLLFIFIPSENIVLHALLLLLTGLSCGSYILAFPISNELAPLGAQSTWAGFTNTLSMISAPLLQPLIGYLLDFFTQAGTTPALASYQKALLPVPIAVFLGGVLIRFLPEKTQEKL